MGSENSKRQKPVNYMKTGVENDNDFIAEISVKESVKEKSPLEEKKQNTLELAWRNTSQRYFHSFFVNKDLELLRINLVDVENLEYLCDIVKRATVDQNGIYSMGVEHVNGLVLTVYVAKKQESIDALNLKKIELEVPIFADNFKAYMNTLSRRLKAFFLCKQISQISFLRLDLCDFSDLNDLIKKENADFKEIQIETESKPLSGTFINYRIWKKQEETIHPPSSLPLLHSSSFAEFSKKKNDAEFVDPSTI